MTDTESTQWLPSVMEEYKALRAEMVVLLLQQYVLVYWTISAVVLLLIAIGTSWDELRAMSDKTASAASSVTLMVVVPALIMGFTTSWSHVITKMALLGAHLFLIERKIAAIVCGGGAYLRLEEEKAAFIPVAWEHVLWRTGSQQLIRRTVEMVLWPVAGVLIATLGTGLASLGLPVWRPGLHFEVWQSALSTVSLFTWSFAWVNLRKHVMHRINHAEKEMIMYSTAGGALNSGDALPRYSR